MCKNVAFAILVLVLASASGRAENLPDWLLSLREAVYEQQLSAAETVPVYEKAVQAARENCFGAALDLALSRCEYFMGRTYQYYEQKPEAAAHYAEGMNFAEQAVDAADSDAAWVMWAENLSQSCAVRSVGFAISNGLNVEKYAKRALEINGRNAAAQYITAARWVFAPAPFSNHKKGIEMMKNILINGDMEKDDRFNVHLAIGYAYIQQKKYDEARPWLEQALTVYPTHKYAAELLNTK